MKLLKKSARKLVENILVLEGKFGPLSREFDDGYVKLNAKAQLTPDVKLSLSTSEMDNGDTLVMVTYVDTQGPRKSGGWIEWQRNIGYVNDKGLSFAQDLIKKLDKALSQSDDPATILQKVQLQLKRLKFKGMSGSIAR